uniref:Gamma-secretase activating protein n=1 Tax=Anser cygnoides TaxID=8845 RepID=A0A8B9D5B3_ANSCY
LARVILSLSFIGFHTLHLGLGVRCLPLHTLLHYIDNGVLHLTETCVRKLLKDLDDTEKNEKLKFSIVTRLPEVPSDVISWNLGVVQTCSLCIGSSVHPYEKQDHVNVRFVEEAALKHTMMLLGLKYS